ncbi:hypothetical protein TSAR_012204 [Trichomalopsis sarcophagae]|uniref:Aminopeptidase n=1 Tax=Trichomalopsis sarcophagae TaxID=543379 RepID=A0A232F800_9HYME|nr:hypothetical protein TSAR_012204 [Trichomalopsis sarcophagae]
MGKTNVRISRKITVLKICIMWLSSQVARMKRMWKTYGRIVILAILFTTAYSKKHDEDTATANSKSGSSTENTTDYRLSGDVVPLEYFIHLKPNISLTNSTFTGTVEIPAIVKKTTSEIVLHAEAIEIDNVSVFCMNKRTGASTKLNVLNVTKIEQYQFLNIRIQSPIARGTHIRIEISYNGPIYDNVSLGLFKSAYKVKNETRYMLATHVAPTIARMVFPCFDEPSFKAIFHLSVDVPQNYNAISNMPVKRITNKRTFEFERTPPMSTYLFALVVSEFQSLSNNNGSHVFKAWSNPDRVDQLSYPLSVLTKAIEFFETHLKVPYALPKLDIVAIPDYIAVAMENWGLCHYRESWMLYDPEVTSITRKRIIRNAVTHELSHQWFGNLVTPQRWDVLWLSEAFGAYFESHAYEDALAPWNLDGQFVVNEMQPSFEGDAKLSTPSVVRPVYSSDEIIAIFDEVVYTKGASLVRMLEKVLGQEMFYGALRRYLVNNKFSSGTPEKMHCAIEEELRYNNYKLGTTAAELLNSWTLQPGFPVVDVYFTGDVATLKQKRFLIKSTENTTEESTWVIPINWATKSHPDFSDTTKINWLTKNQTTIRINNASKDWVVINIQRTGYYRVNYDVKMWKRIIKALKSTDYQTIHEINRASVIDDLFNLARVGAVEYDLVLSGTQYLAQETNFIPWQAALKGFNYLKKRLTGHPEIYNQFKSHVLSLIVPIYQKLGFDDIKGESLLDAHLRELILQWSCTLDSNKCVNESLNRFQKLQQNSSYRVPPNQQSIVYCMAVKHGSSRNWDYLWQKFEKSNSGAEQLTILSALACSENSTDLERFLLKAIDPNSGIRKHDVDNVFEYIIEASTIGVQAAMDFIGNHYTELQEYITDESSAFIALDKIAGYLPTEDLVKKFDNFIQNNEEKLVNIIEEVQGFLENSVYELNWYKKYAPKISKSLTNIQSS